MNAEEIDGLLADLDDRVVERGRGYAARGLVNDVEEREDGARASVLGSSTYQVNVTRATNGAWSLWCDCPAFGRESECKHVAALLLVMRVRAGAPTNGAARNGHAARAFEPLPEVFRLVHSAAGFFARLSLYAGERLEDDGDDRYATLSSWWWRATQRPTKRSAELRERVLSLAPEVGAVFDTLRTWRPPPPAEPGTAYASFQTKLAQVYQSTRKNVRLRGALPGPLDDRHPGFELAFDPKHQTLHVTERRSPLGPAPLRFGVRVPVEPGGDVRLEGSWSTHETDAWELFALRALLIALGEPSTPALEPLRRELGRPVWEYVLDKISAGSRPATSTPREWAFSLLPMYRGLEYRVIAHARPARLDGRPAKYKRQSFEALLADESATKLEHEIARVALAATGSYGKPETILVLGTPVGHELARLLAQHPRCRAARSPRSDPDADPPVRILAGPLTMSLDRHPGGALSPRFHAGSDPLPVPVRELHGRDGSIFRGAATFVDTSAPDDDVYDDAVYDDEPARGPTIVSVEVPPPLRGWLEMAARMGDELVFPREAVPKLAAATESLSSRGMVRLPREALGDELAYTPSAGIRVEWLPMTLEGVSAKIELLVVVHPGAPFVQAGEGPAIFTFEHEGKRVFVERDLEKEVPMLERVAEKMSAPVEWFGTTGHTTGIEETVKLAEYLERNPLGLPIEVKVGRPPVVAPWPDELSRLEVTRSGRWLVLDGGLVVKGAKLTMGEVLEAVRHARRYVRAGEGVFLELSKSAIAKLGPVALASELAPKDADDDGEPAAPRVHDAFGSLLLEARTLFGRVRARGLDIDDYARRLSGRDRRVKLPSLDHGELRPYQRDGARWMLGLAAWAPGCILADDMGLGKTVQTAVVLKARAKLGPSLVVAPASVASNWVAELRRFVPSLAVRWYNSERDVSLTSLAAGEVLVVSYGLLQRESDAFAERRWETVVIDEAQYVKNSVAQRRDAISSLERGFTIALTGTPLENHLGELHSIVDLVFPGLLGDEASFRERFRKPIESRAGIRDSERLAALGRLLEPFLLRRTRAAVLQELPAREDITEQIELSPDETRRYLALRRACEEALARRDTNRSPQQMKIEILAALTRLRQLACDASLVDPTFTGTPTKIARTVELVRELAEEGNRALVFSQFTTFLDRVRASLEAAGLRVAYLTGEVPTTKRRPIVDAFQAGEYDVFCVSLLAGGTGLNLTRASYVIHLDPWWNPAAEEQATSRAHRMGQNSPVTVYRLVAKGTIEQAVLEMQASKRELAAAVLEGKGDVKSITSDELLALLRFDG